MPGLSDSEHSDDDSSDDEEEDFGVDNVNVDNVREVAAGADDGVAAVPQLPRHADQGGGAAADGQTVRHPPPVQAVAGGQPDQQGGLPVQAGDGSAAAGDQTIVSNS